MENLIIFFNFLTNFCTTDTSMTSFPRTTTSFSPPTNCWRHRATDRRWRAPTTPCASATPQTTTSTRHQCWRHMRVVTRSSFLPTRGELSSRAPLRRQMPTRATSCWTRFPLRWSSMTLMRTESDPHRLVFFMIYVFDAKLLF